MFGYPKQDELTHSQPVGTDKRMTLGLKKRGNHPVWGEDKGADKDTTAVAEPWVTGLETKG